MSLPIATTHRSKLAQLQLLERHCGAARCTQRNLLHRRHIFPCNFPQICYRYLLPWHPSHNQRCKHKQSLRAVPEYQVMGMSLVS